MCVFYILILIYFSFLFFFFNDTATTEIYTLSLHDALPICLRARRPISGILRRLELLFLRPQTQSADRRAARGNARSSPRWRDRKSTRLNSSHSQISYAVFCLKKKKE